MHSVPEYQPFLDQIKQHAEEMKVINKVPIGSCIWHTDSLLCNQTNEVQETVCSIVSSASKESRSIMSLSRS